MCDCIKQIDKKLSDKNTRAEINLLDDSPKAIISTTKIDSRKRGSPIVLFASYCPFCGEKYA